MNALKYFEPSEALKRLPKQFFANLVSKVNQVVSQGADVINLGQGNPDQPTPPHIVKAMQEAAEKSEFHRYSPFRGYAFLKQAVAEFYQREYQVKVDPETEVAILFGGKVGLVEISQCFLNPGDTALVPDPGYPDYWSGIKMAGAEMVTMPLREENQFLPDFSSIPNSVWKRAKLMFLNYPNNPTGAVADREFFSHVVQLAEKYDVLVVHDFAYGAIGFDGQKPISFLEVEGAKEVGVEIYTMSKTYNMAGWRVAFAVGNPSVISAIELIQDHFYVSLFGAVQKAAEAALLGPQDCVRDLVKLYQKRRDVFIESLQRIGWDVKAPKGSFFCWLPVPKGYTSETFADLLLQKAHVGVAPGIGFGQEGDRYIRVGLLTDEDRLIEAAERIGQLEVFKKSLT